MGVLVRDPFPGWADGRRGGVRQGGDARGAPTPALKYVADRRESRQPPYGRGAGQRPWTVCRLTHPRPLLWRRTAPWGDRAGGHSHPSARDRRVHLWAGVAGPRLRGPGGGTWRPGGGGRRPTGGCGERGRGGGPAGAG